MKMKLKRGRNGVFYRQQRLIKPIKMTNGYLVASLAKDVKVSQQYLHRIVCKAFLPNPNNFPEVNHIDGNKANNCVDNLEWVSKSQNKWHACNVLGQRTNRIKDFSTGIVFPSQKSAALYYGVSESLIRSIVKKQIFSKRKKKQEITNHRIEIISEREYIDSLNKSELVDVVNELQHDNSEKANYQENVQPEPVKVYVCADGSVYDNESVAKSHAAGLPDHINLNSELAHLQKENSNLKDEVELLQKKLEMAINVIDTCRQYERGTACIAPDNLAVYCDIAIKHIRELETKGGDQ
jgi:hypothetical protein